MAPEERSTLLRPPPADPNKAPIENVLEVTEVGVLGPDIFTNTRRAWVPPGARGVYGGTVIAQCLASAQKTVPDDFYPHSCHCYFILAGSGSIPILFHVERVRDGRSFATRTVQARQRGRCIFTTTISFVREDAGGERTVRHAVPMPDEAKAPPPLDWQEEPEWARGGPFQNYRMPAVRGSDPTARPDEQRCQQWMRCRGKISDAGGRQAHLNALAYVSDSTFIGTVGRVHRLWRLPFKPEDYDGMAEEYQPHVKDLAEFEGLGSTVEEWKTRPKLGMMVSLDHSIYFHEPGRVKVDEWMFADMESPWSGDGRGFVTQRIFAKDGTLLATCVQEASPRRALRDVNEANLLVGRCATGSGRARQEQVVNQARNDGAVK
ncbi:Acyl-coenzyme A thioesterase 8 [Metarhizium anisopliae]|nr:Acyl-coenzyme A thioesterase 8 [Metarhizium anisopliae]